MAKYKYLTTQHVSRSASVAKRLFRLHSHCFLSHSLKVSNFKILAQNVGAVENKALSLLIH